MRIKNISTREIVRPLRVVFATSLGEKAVIRSVMVRVGLEDGTTGLGECPTSFVLKQETVPAIKETIREASRHLIGRPIGSYNEIIERLRSDYRRYPMTISGLETALFRTHLAGQRIEEHTYWGARANSLETDITIPFVPDLVKLEHWISYALREGFRTFKIKVSGKVNEDRRFIKAFYERINCAGEGLRMRLDGNQGYSAETYMELVDFLSREGLQVELFEQPLPKDDYKGLEGVTKRSPVPIILDETVFTAQDAQRAVDNGFGHGINIKVAKSGIAESEKILVLARKHSLKLMAGCMTETMTGLSAGIYLAAGTGAFDYIDLDSIHFLYHRDRYGAITLKGPEFILDEPHLGN